MMGAEKSTIAKLDATDWIMGALRVDGTMSLGFGAVDGRDAILELDALAAAGLIKFVRALIDGQMIDESNRLVPA